MFIREMVNDAGLATSVMVGLTIGIGLIALFAMLAKPAFTMSDDEIREKVRSLPEVQAYYERYTPLEQIRRDGTATYVTYELTRQVHSTDNNDSDRSGVLVIYDGYASLLLTVKVDAFGKTSMVVECLGPISGSQSDHVLEFIKTTECIQLQGYEYASES